LDVLLIVNSLKNLELKVLPFKFLSKTLNLRFVFLKIFTQKENFKKIVLVKILKKMELNLHKDSENYYRKMLLFLRPFKHLKFI
jgi:hypothetical protein